jgi:hypothetical protein
MGLPYIRGYKPRFNYQQLLEQKVGRYLNLNRNSLMVYFENFAESTALPSKPIINFESILGEEPKPTVVSEHEPSYRPIKINYLKKEQDNRKLGEQGEELVMEYERHRLISKGKPGLAERIEWVSREKGDGLGFDILSRNENGTDRYIEVKTTKLSNETPIFLTRTEISFAAFKQQDFFLYRLYNFDREPKLFIRNGEYKAFCKLLPESYKGYF